jgi:hypothetical protein
MADVLVAHIAWLGLLSEARGYRATGFPKKIAPELEHDNE